MAFDIGSILGSNIADAVAKIIGLFKVDPTVALQKQAEIQELQLQIAAQLQNKLQDAINQQIEVDKVEAGSPDWVAANWRPAVGWVCAMGLFLQFIVNPLFTWISVLAKHPTPFPSLDLGTLMTLLFGMLGMTGWHAYENVKTAANGK
jgi:hypothetical protein